MGGALLRCVRVASIIAIFRPPLALAGFSGVKSSTRGELEVCPRTHLRCRLRVPVERGSGRKNGSRCRGTTSAALRRLKRRTRRSACMRRGWEINAKRRWDDTGITKCTTTDRIRKSNIKCAQIATSKSLMQSCNSGLVIISGMRLGATWKSRLTPLRDLIRNL